MNASIEIPAIAVKAIGNNHSPAATQNDTVSKRRRLFEAVALVINASIEAIVRLDEIGNIESELSLWQLRQQNRSETTRFGSLQLRIILGQILGGDRAFLVDAIRDLHAAAPELVSPLMSAFLLDAAAKSNKQVRALVVEDSKTLGREMFASRFPSYFLPTVEGGF